MNTPSKAPADRRERVLVMLPRLGVFMVVSLFDFVWLVWANRDWLPIEAEIPLVSALASSSNFVFHNVHLLVLGFLTVIAS